jgi:hypothetical protein
MLPRWHILYGSIFAALLYVAAPKTNLIYVLLVFLASVFIDLDHYFCSVVKGKHLSLKKAFEYHQKLNVEEEKRKGKGIKQKGDFHLFHTIEFHILIGLLGIFWVGFFYIFIGMMFHSLIDIYSLLFVGKEMYRREFFLSAWLWKKLKR